jgi:hypothetical protein
LKIKNNTKANFQFNVRMNPGETVTQVNQFGNEVTVAAKPDIQLVHIPSGATVILDDKIYDALMAAKTTVYGYEDVVEDIEDADILMGKSKLKVKSRIQTGESKEVSLFELAINNNEIIVIDKQPIEEIPIDAMEAFLTNKGITLAEGMSTQQIEDLYYKLK